MRLLNYIFLIALALIFFSCEKATLVDVDVEAQEYVVIRGEIKTGSYLTEVSITRTLPLDVKYDIKLAEIKDAYAYIKINGVQVVPLHYTSNGIYSPKYEMEIKAGNTYELFAKVNGKQIYSKTIAPQAPVVTSSNFVDGKYFQVKVTPSAGEVYGAAWVVGSGPIAKAVDYYSIEKIDPELPYNPIMVRTLEIPQVYLESQYNDKRFVQVYSFDNQYLDYFQSKGKNLPVENTFVQGGSSINWNVSGDKVIGLFIGVAEGSIISEF